MGAFAMTSYDLPVGYINTKSDFTAFSSLPHNCFEDPKGAAVPCLRTTELGEKTRVGLLSFLMSDLDSGHCLNSRTFLEYTID